jgi:cytochrome P450/NADPH-cytochrome P450 reductase
MRIGGKTAAHLPMHRAIRVSDLLRQSVELQDPATRAQIREIAAATQCPPHRRELEALLENDAYRHQVLEKRVTMLDLLESYPACELTFERFLDLLPPLKPRYYSISSSPRVSPDRASITVGVTRGPAWSGRGEYLGIASNYLASLPAGDAVSIFVRTPDSGFQPPEDPATPIIMVGPGTGVAPFRGFLQLRRALLEQGAKLGEAHLYFGCRDPQCDFLYREEFERDARDGIVTLHTAFSRVNGQPRQYVQHLMKGEAAKLIGLLDAGAKLFVCGDGAHMAPDVEATLCEAYEQIHGGNAQAWIDQLQRERRYVKDIWSA